MKAGSLDKHSTQKTKKLSLCSKRLVHKTAFSSSFHSLSAFHIMWKVAMSRGDVCKCFTVTSHLQYSIS